MTRFVQEVALHDEHGADLPRRRPQVRSEIGGVKQPWMILMLVASVRPVLLVAESL